MNIQNNLLKWKLIDNNIDYIFYGDVIRTYKIDKIHNEFMTDLTKDFNIDNFKNLPIFYNKSSYGGCGPFSKIFLNALKINTSIKILKIDDLYEEVDMIKLYKSLKNNIKLGYIEIALNNNTPDNIDYLYKILENKPYLKYLFLRTINSIDINLLSKFLENNNTLKYLQLCRVQITNIQPICNFLKSNTSLKYLDISCNNKINDNSFSLDIKLLCEVLKNNTTLKYLDLSTNNIKDIESIVNLLKYNKIIQINIKNNYILEKYFHIYPNKQVYDFYNYSF